MGMYPHETHICTTCWPYSMFLPENYRLPDASRFDYDQLDIMYVHAHVCTWYMLMHITTNPPRAPCNTPHHARRPISPGLHGIYFLPDRQP